MLMLMLMLAFTTDQPTAWQESLCRSYSNTPTEG